MSRPTYDDLVARVARLESDLDLCLDEAPPQSTLRENLQGITLAAERARQLTSRILTFSRGAVDERRPVRLRELIDEVLTLVRAGLPSSIEIRSDFEDFDPTALVDPSQVHDVVLNLCTNAAHAMGEKGVLSVELAPIHFEQGLSGRLGPSPPGDDARVTVRDTGCGMSEDVVDRMFEPFFTTKPVGEGTGLGLAVTYGAVKANDGNITVESAPGVGTAVTLYLPLKREPPQPLPSEVDVDPRGRERILVVDDEPLVGRVIAASLARRGYETKQFDNGFHALQVIREDQGCCDLVITDQTMPEMTGLELTASIHQLRSDLPVVLMSGYGAGVNAVAAAAAGIAALVEKPLPAVELARKVREVLDRRR